MSQYELVNLEELVQDNDEYRKFKSLWSFSSVEKMSEDIKADNPNEGSELIRLSKCLLLQFMEDLSDET